MYNKALFIDPNVLKNRYVLDINIDEKIISAAVLNAQEYYIYRLLGTNLYNRISSEIISWSISTDVQYLLDNYISSALLHYSMSELIKYLSFRFTNKGVVQKESEKSNIVDYETLEKLRADEISIANYFADRMIRYILANESKFPEYSISNNIDEILPSFSAYDPIYFGYRSYLEDDLNSNSEECL